MASNRKPWNSGNARGNAPDPWGWWSNSYLPESFDYSVPLSSQVPLDFAKTLRSGTLTQYIQAPRKGSQYLCSLCRGLNAERLSQNNGYLHVRDMNELNSGAEELSNHCILCGIFSFSISKASGKANSKLVWPATLRCRLINPGTRESKLLLSNYILDSLNDKDDIAFDIYTNEGDPAAEFGIKTRKVLTNTSSSKSFEVAIECFEDCLLHHHCSQVTKVKDEDPFGDHCQINENDHLSLDEFDIGSFERSSPGHPSRLIDLHPHGPYSVDARLIDVTEKCGLYAALSYCWGPVVSSEYMLTNDVITRYNLNIPYESLPRTIQEAFQIARRLGVRYIWIDALCIVQDDQVDWQREAAKMGPIYSNALFTIAANASTAATGGCFNQISWPRDRLLENVITIDSILSDGRRSCLYICREMDHVEILKFPSVRDSIESGTLNSRGWTYQERFLSPRILHYSASQLFWECRHCFHAEDAFSTNNFEYPYSCRHEEPVATKYCPNHGQKTLPCSVSLLVKASPGTYQTRQLLRLWYGKILPDYTKRIFTYSKDRLYAIAGIARLMSQSLESEYIFGLWDVDLPFGLAWIKNDPRCANSAVDGSSLPSFSWASQSAQLRWTDSYYREKLDPWDVRIVSFAPEITKTEEESPPDPFTMVRSGWLSCIGYITPVFVCQMRGKYQGTYQFSTDEGSPLGRVWIDNESWFDSFDRRSPASSSKAFPAHCLFLFTGDEYRYVVMLMEKIQWKKQVSKRETSMPVDAYKRIGVGEIDRGDGRYWKNCKARDFALV